MRSLDLLVLDVHGVVLNRPLRAFLRELAHLAGEPEDALLRRWDEELRLRAWTGAITDAELWGALLPGATGSAAAKARARLERRYAPGPAAPWLARWRSGIPVWLLSNHRADCLHPRLERLGLAGHFERVLVSDEIGAAKPDPRAFHPVLAAVTTPERVLFVDDQEHNVRAARALGLQALRVDATPESIVAVDAALVRAGALPHDGRTPVTGAKR